MPDGAREDLEPGTADAAQPAGVLVEATDAVKDLLLGGWPLKGEAVQAAGRRFAALGESVLDTIVRADPRELTLGTKHLAGVLRSAVGRLDSAGHLRSEPSYWLGRFAGFVEVIRIMQDRTRQGRMEQLLESDPELRKLVRRLGKERLRQQDIRMTRVLGETAETVSRKLAEIAKAGILIKHKRGRENVWRASQAALRWLDRFEQELERAGRMPSPLVFGYTVRDQRKGEEDNHRAFERSRPQQDDRSRSLAL